jgi:trimeric autotransporter adhesin
MAYTKYSLTPANNTAAPPDGAPEGMLPSAVNDTMRDMMAQIRDCGDGIRDGTYTMTAPKITGGTITGSTINNSAIGGTTAAAGKFTTLEATGVATFSAGAVGTPAITTTGDTNTGIYFPAADTIAFTEGGVESMRIDSAGNVGIGTATTSNSKFTVVASTSGTGGIRIESQFGASYFGNYNNYPAMMYDGASLKPINVYDTNNNANILYTNNTEKMRIDTNGNVGIGTSSPQATLDVSYGNASRADTLRLTNTNTSGYGSWLNFYGNYNGGYSFAKIGTENDGTGGSMRFHTADTSEVSQERMRITSAGRVGIGTTSPNRALHVATGVLTLGNSAGALFTDTNNAGVLLGSDNAIGYISGVTAAGTGTAKLLLQPFGDEVLVAATTDNGAYNLQCNGTGVWGAGAYVNGSDERIKENIAPLDSGLDVIAKLNPVTYKYKKTWSKDQSTQTGFIAQELLVALEGQNYVDGVVQQGGSESYYSVAYQNIIPILTKAVQEQQALIENLTTRLNALEGN